jgi:hypothetical protein
MRPNNNIVFTNVAANANRNSLAQWATDIIRTSFQIVVTTGTATGTMKVQASNEKAFGLPANQFQPTDWSDLGAMVVLNGIGSYLIPSLECSYEYLRLVYTDSSGGTATGLISCRMASKAL